MKLIVVCNRPGLIRGGRRNPEVAEYAADEIGPAQLSELLGEPAITVVYGVRLTAGTGGVDGAIEQAREALAISVGLNLDGIGDALVPEPQAVVAGPHMEQGTDAALSGALEAVTEADAPVRTVGRRRT